MLTCANLELHVTSALEETAHDLPPSGGDIEKQIINEAGRYMFTHPWNFRIRDAARISVESISITDGTWTESTKTLTSTGAFTSYYHTAGGTITVSDGTGVTAGTYTIGSRTSADAIVLDTSLSTDEEDLATGDIEAELVMQSVALPTDFGELLSAVMTSNSSTGIEMTSLEAISLMRALSSSSGGVYYGAIYQPPQLATTSTIGNPRLAIWPTLDEATTDWARVTYRAAWTELAADTSYAEIPPWAESLLIAYIRALAQAYGNDEIEKGDERLQKIDDSSLFRRVAEKDGLWTFDEGRPSGGAVGGKTFHRATAELADPE